jgi:SAM-dependent methyltransferase
MECAAEGVTMSPKISPVSARHIADFPTWHSPVSGQPLALQGDRLVAADGEEFSVINGIPRFVGAEEYCTNFGAQWNRFPLTQLDSVSGLTTTSERLRRCLGQEVWNRLAGMHVLECGCGAGRFTEILLREGAFVTSVDISSAVDANAQNFPISGNHRIAQADILQLPFEPRQFDCVICLGVIQHTPDPERAIATLYQQVKPGGFLAIDHYTFHWGRATSTRPIFRLFFRRMSPKRAELAVERLVDLFLPWHKRFEHNRVGWQLLCRISPVTNYYRVFPQFTDQQHREWALLDTHDSLTDWFKHLRSSQQIRETLESLGVVDLWVAKEGNGIEARGRRPS